jgi:chromosome segregation protein
LKFDRLRLTGFKTFVEATDFLIEPGLTGVVGPNGCGKSNLVEAMRWVMGETSSKSMRAAGMDDVIFSGSGTRPARNMAEVGLVLDNSTRAAPAAFNDADILEVTRRIERDSGSTYRVNGREVRARDVQLLFADAATGARSTAMVRQGQIGEIIAAKPQTRRRILEEAAGIAGLHARRHEAELRLKAAEDNLARVEDVLRQIEGQSESLKRQARQSARYRTLAGAIRKAEALLALIHFTDATEGLAQAERKLEADVRAVAERTLAQAETARLQAIAAHELPPLRVAETEAAGVVQRLVLARETLDGEERRTEARAAEVKRRIAQMTEDLARQTALIEDAAGDLDRLAAEEAQLAVAGGEAATREEAVQARLDAARATLAISEEALTDAQARRADVEARRAAAERLLREESQRFAQIETELHRLATDRAAVEAALGDEAGLAALASGLAAALAAAAQGETASAAAEAVHAQAREAEGRLRGPLAEAERTAQRLETEVSTLTKLLNAGGGGFWPPVTDEITVAKGYEAALGAALGDDLDASTNPTAPAHWASIDAAGDPSLPPGVISLATMVEAPAALQRRLAQIGIVLRVEGPQLRALLRPGQRLVSREGDLWRWDGFTQAAEAPTPAARRLAEKNRLGDLTIAAREARTAADGLKIEAEAAQAALRAAAASENDARQAHREALRAVDAARETHTAAERRGAEAASRLSVLEEALTRLTVSRDEAAAKRAAAEGDLAGLGVLAELTAALEGARAAAARDRAAVSETQAEWQALQRETEARRQRLEAIGRERAAWLGRRERATSQIEEFAARLAEARTEEDKLGEAPAEFQAARRTLLGQMEAAEAARNAAADARAAAETALATADTQARAALEAMSAAREEKARSEARLEAATARKAEIAESIAADLDCAPTDLATLAGVERGAELPPAGEIAQKLEGLKQDRERLGAVNLRAEEELAEVEASLAGLVGERDDLAEAIRRLRQAIGSLNKEGRERLVTAFETVNGHFKELFTVLFGGGSAELQLIESDDPLEAGLEIVAKPPGKKPQVMTLLSGGEQALTALSLIFAVFLTNPSPICVLDEVDAPLDDANVERFCDLLDDMRKRTDTRFVTITHNPITMARMDRLFGVTMAERGVSQLVSVDLAAAERFLEAG